MSTRKAVSPEFTEAGLMRTNTADSERVPGPHHADVPKPTCCVGSGINAIKKAAIIKPAPATIPTVRMARQWLATRAFLSATGQQVGQIATPFSYLTSV